MRSSIMAMSILALAASASGHAQSTQPQGQILQTSPNIRAKIAPIKPTIPRDGILRTVQSKKDFVANSLNVDPDSIGFSEALALRPPHGEFAIPGKIELSARNVYYYSPREGSNGKFEIDPDGSVEISMTPAANLTNTYLLVSLTMRARFGVSSVVEISHVANNSRQKIEKTLAQAETLNFIHYVGRDTSSIRIMGVPQRGSAYGGWQLDRIEVAPITR